MGWRALHSDEHPPETLASFLETSKCVCLVRIDDAGCIRFANDAFRSLVGRPADELEGTLLTELLAVEEVRDLDSLLKAAGKREAPVHFRDSASFPQSLRCTFMREPGGWLMLGEPDIYEERGAMQELLRLQGELNVLTRDAERQRREMDRLASQLTQTLAELRQSHWLVRKIQEHVPVCMRCSRLKASGVSWESIADYLLHNEVFVSHGYCPQCAEQVMAEFGLTDEE
jgi:hypothetical protein